MRSTLTPTSSTAAAAAAAPNHQPGSTFTSSSIEQSDPLVRREHANLLTRIYFNPVRVGSLGGSLRLLKEANEVLKRARKQPLSESVVRLWLSSKEPYVVHKAVRSRRFKRNPATPKSNRVLSLVQADIIHYADIPHQGYKYLLLLLDVPSRYLLFRFLKTKTCKEVLSKLRSVFEHDMPRTPDQLQTDAGLEFRCAEFQQYMSEIGCNHFFVGTGDSGKTPHLDNATRTLQRRLHRYFTHRETTNWVSVIPALISSQNRMVNKVIGRAPKDLWEKQQSSSPPPSTITSSSKPTREDVKFKVGQW